MQSISNARTNPRSDTQGGQKTQLIPRIINKALRTAIFSLVFMSACVSRDTIPSSSVAPREIYQSYSIFGNKNETNVYAFFLVGGSSGTTVDLQPPSGIAFNGRQMKKAPPDFLKGTSYTIGENGYQSLHEIIYTASDGEVYRNRVRLEAAEFDASGEPFVLRRSQANFIPLTRTAFVDEENLRLVLSNEEFQPQPDKQFKADLPPQFDHSRKALVVAPETLGKLPAGKATLVMVVSRKQELAAQSPAGGSLDISYAAKPIEVRITD